MSVSPSSEPDPTAERPDPLLRRIGDAERDQAVSALQEHMAQGRLDRDEFDERMTTALNARTAADLDPLFGDLPEPRPAGTHPQTPFTPPPWSGASAVALPPSVPASEPVVAEPEPARPLPRGAAIAMAAVWPATVLLYVLSGFDHWWLFVVAAMVTWFVRRAFSSPSRPGDPGQDRGPRSLDR